MAIICSYLATCISGDLQHDLRPVNIFSFDSGVLVCCIDEAMKQSIAIDVENLRDHIYIITSYTARVVNVCMPVPQATHLFI